MVDAATLSVVLGEQLAAAQARISSDVQSLFDAKSDTLDGQLRHILAAAMVARISPPKEDVQKYSYDANAASILAAINRYTRLQQNIGRKGRIDFDSEFKEGTTVLTRSQFMDRLLAVPGAYRAPQRVRGGIEHIFNEQLGVPL